VTRYAAVDSEDDLPGAIASLSPRAGRPVLVLLGGAAGQPAGSSATKRAPPVGRFSARIRPP
jgi:hypothetical protein